MLTHAEKLHLRNQGITIALAFLLSGVFFAAKWVTTQVTTQRFRLHDIASENRVPVTVIALLGLTSLLYLLDSIVYPSKESRIYILGKEIHLFFLGALWLTTCMGSDITMTHASLISVFLALLAWATKHHKKRSVSGKKFRRFLSGFITIVFVLAVALYLYTPVGA